MTTSSGGAADRDGQNEGWWTAIEHDVLACLDASGGAAPAEIARHVGISERAVCSVVSMLVDEGKVRIGFIERA